MARRAFLGAAEQAPERRLGHYYLALADWELGLALAGSAGTEERIGDLTREGVRHCDLWLERDETDAEVLALRGGLKLLRARARAPEAQSLTEAGDADLRRSRSLAAGNPRVWLISGHTRFACQPGEPAAREATMRDLRRCLELFERVPESLAELSGGTPDPLSRGPIEAWGGPAASGAAGPAGGSGAAGPAGSSDARPAARGMSLEPDWGYEEAWLLAGRVHLAADRRDAARRCFEKVLEINPSSDLVRDQLLPRASGNISGSRPSGGASRPAPGGPQSVPPGRPVRAGLPR
jgi:tetratricopeptide (TPR) repeat protein